MEAGVAAPTAAARRCCQPPAAAALAIPQPCSSWHATFYLSSFYAETATPVDGAACQAQFNLPIAASIYLCRGRVALTERERAPSIA